MEPKFPHMFLQKRDWTAFFFEVGHSFSRRSKEKKSEGVLNIAISVPFNFYTALSIGAGMAHSEYSYEIENKENNLEWLKRVKYDTLVFYSTSSGEISYKFKGFSQKGFPILGGVGRRNRGLTMTLENKETWKNIRVAPEQQKYKRGRIIYSDPSLERLSDYYGKENVKRLFNLGEPLFFIIGNEKQIRTEVFTQFEEGATIQDSVRIRNFGGRQYSFLSEFISATGGWELKGTSIVNPDVLVIFDGAVSYLNYRKKFKSNPAVILLSRESTIDKTIEALEKIEEEFIDRNIGDDNDFLQDLVSLEPPYNIEIISWRSS